MKKRSVNERDSQKPTRIRLIYLLTVHDIFLNPTLSSPSSTFRHESPSEQPLKGKESARLFGLRDAARGGISSGDCGCLVQQCINLSVISA